MKPKLSARKVAFLGSSTSSRSLAPLDNPDWEVWATGPGCHNDPNFKSRFSRWFELHDMCDNDPQYGAVIDPGYFEWLQQIAKEKPVYYRPPLYGDLVGEEFPWDEIHAKHCGYFLDSTVAWMMAFAYEFCDVDEIGLYGIDFATDAERMKQRKGTKHFIDLFRMRGVPCDIPDVSDMSFNPPPYPEISNFGSKLHFMLKRMEIEGQQTEKLVNDIRSKATSHRELLEKINATIGTLEMMRDNWS